MCFSAPASFIAAATLAAVGAATLAQRPRRQAFAFALIPLIFAAHQALEGGIWLAIGAGRAPPSLWVDGYLFIAQVLWPTYVPFAVLQMERGRRQRQGLLILLAAGLIVSLALGYGLIRYEQSAVLVEHGIRYASAHGFENRLVGLYLLTTTAPLFVTRHRYVLAFGVAILVGSIVTELFFYRASASVWCFFAAVSSVFVWLHARQERLRAATAVAPA